MGDGKGAAHDFVEALRLFLSKSGDHSWNTDEAKRIFSMAVQLAQQAMKECEAAGVEMKEFDADLQAAMDLMQNDPAAFAIHVVEDIIKNRTELLEEVYIYI